MPFLIGQKEFEVLLCFFFFCRGGVGGGVRGKDLSTESGASFAHNKY